MASRNLYEILCETAALHPQAPALEYADKSVSYQTLLERVEDLRARLVTAGVRPGDRVAAMMGRDFDEPALILALSACRAVFANFNRLWKPAQVSYGLNYLKPRFFITPRITANRLRAAEGFQPPAGCLLPFEDLLDLRPHEHPAAVTGKPSLQDLGAIIFTSGSSGFPKGVMHSNAGLIRWTESTVRYLGNRPGDRVLVILPLAFGYGLNQLLCMIHCGGCYRISRSVLASDIVTELRENPVTGLAGIPAFWRDFGHAVGRHGEEFSLRYMTNAGGHCPPAILATLRDHIPGADMVLMYGTTETLRSAYLPPHLFDRKMGALGVPVPGAEVLLLNADGAPCQPGELGEIVHRGPTVARGYFAMDAAASEKFRPAPVWLEAPEGEKVFYTGDLARRDEDGILWFETRRDRQLKINGFRISPNEIEDVARQLDFVDDAIAVCVKKPDQPEAIHLAVAVKENREPPAADQVTKHLRSRVANYMVPAKIYFWDQPFPRTANGKTDYGTVQRLLNDNAALKQSA